MNKRFEEVEHTADIAIRVWGRQLDELFANAAYGMACQVAEIGGVDESVEQTIEVVADDLETLLVTFLGELLYLLERDECVFHVFQVHEVTDSHLLVTARGGVVRERRHYIKAVTFNDLKITHNDLGYETAIVFDV